MRCSTTAPVSPQIPTSGYSDVTTASARRGGAEETACEIVPACGLARRTDRPARQPGGAARGGDRARGFACGGVTLHDRGCLTAGAAHRELVAVGPALTAGGFADGPSRRGGAARTPSPRSGGPERRAAGGRARRRDQVRRLALVARAQARRERGDGSRAVTLARRTQGRHHVVAACAPDVALRLASCLVEPPPRLPAVETGGARRKRAARDRVVARCEDRQRAVEQGPAGAGNRLLAALRRIDTRRCWQDGDGGQHRHEQDTEEHDLMGYRTAFARASETSPVPDVSRRAVMPRVA